MKSLTVSIAALVALAIIVAALTPGNTAGALLALGAPFALFANVMATEPPQALDQQSAAGRGANGGASAPTLRTPYAPSSPQPALDH
jgi:hypothetical protein